MLQPRLGSTELLFERYRILMCVCERECVCVRACACVKRRLYGEMM